MKLLAVADIHSSRRGLNTVLELAKEHGPDLIAIAGDVTTFGPVEFARELADALPARTIFVPGNCDIPPVADVFNTGERMNLHLKKQVVDGIHFVGLGGWMASPALTEDWGIPPADAIEKIEPLFDDKTVLLTHVPPYGHLDAVPTPFGAIKKGREHIGSTELNILIERARPALVVSGHVHENRGVEEAAGTLFVNPGPAKNGFGAIIEFYRMQWKARLLKIE